jgi:glycosyltransferase involved in cell wall biosynthesis
MYNNALKKNGKKKCLIIYPYFALYRKHFFDALFSSDFGWEFELVGDKECEFGIKGIDPNLASESKSKGGYNWTFAKNWLPLGKKIPFSWQPGILKRIFKKDYDAIIMLGSIYYIAYIFAIPIIKFFKVPIIFWTHGFLGKDNQIIEKLRHLLYRQADANLLYGERAMKIMRQSGYYENRYLDVIYNSLDYGSLDRVNAKGSDFSSIRDTLFQYPDKPLVIATGRVTKEKRFDLLLEALYNSVRFYSKYFNLLIIGEGPELDSLKEYARNKGIQKYIAFTGAIYGDEVYKYLMASDLCVIPGNVGLSAMHSLSAGIPVISHNNFNIQMPEFEAIIDGETGSFYEYENINDLIKKIHDWAFDKQKLSNASSCCREIIKKKYHVDNQMKIIKKCLNTVCND